MLIEGKVRLFMYRVVWYHDNSHHNTYWYASSAQQAVDSVRKHFLLEGVEIVEVAKVVNNWK